MNNKKYDFIYIICLFIILVLLCIFVPNNQLYTKKGELYINEILSSNNSSIKDKYGKYTDYIEIYNGYNEDIDLTGYYLSDDSNETRKWSFPSITIKANSYLVVFASGKNTVIDNEIHTSFKLDSKGESVILSNSDGDIISKIYSNTTFKDTSYGYNGEDYVYYYIATPGYENSGKWSKKPITSLPESSDLLINEYIVNNTKYNKSSNGKYYSLIELYNDDDMDINLNDYYLTNDINNLRMYQLPDIIIKSKEYVVIYASGLNNNDKEVHTNFVLNDDTKLLVLSDNYNNILQKVNVDQKNKNISSGIYDGEFVSYTNTSFGSVNLNNYDKGTIVNNVLINEVSSVPTSFIELKNNSSNDVNLNGYTLNIGSNYSCTLDKQVIKANGFLVINSKVCNDLSINNHDEKISLIKNGYIVNSFNAGKLINNVSIGISDTLDKVYYKNITMGTTNSNNKYLGYTSNVNFSIDGGYVDKDTIIYLSSDKDSKIYYTLDGSWPSNKSLEYKDGIKISKTVVVKAIAYKDNYIESDTLSRTFFVNDTHDIAIVSVSSDNDSFFGSNGLFTRYRTELFKKINFEFYESDGTFGIEFTGETKLVGADSRNQPQKSMAVYLRKKYGDSSVTYPFFEISDVNEYSSFTLRNSGEDPNKIKLKDAFLVKAIKDNMDIDAQDYRPVAVYLNGQYYGLYYLREKVNDDFVETNYKIDKDDIDLIKGNNNVRVGTMDNYEALKTYLKTHDIKKKEVYEYVKTQIDIQELINYWITQTFYANTDTGNIAFWKSSEGKWRWILFDQDWALYPSTYSYMSLNYPFKPNGHGTRNYFSTYITYRLFQNSEFKDQYLSNLAYHLKNTFNPDRMISILDEMSKEIENEIPKHIERWHDEYVEEGMSYLSKKEDWERNINNFKNIIKGRYSVVLKRLKNDFDLSDADYQKYFGELS